METMTALDFLPADTLIVVDDPEAGRDRLLRYTEEAYENFDLAREAGRLALPPDALALAPDDLEAAIAEGATWLRIGTAIFGERN